MKWMEGLLTKGKGSLCNTRTICFSWTSRHLRLHCKDNNKAHALTAAQHYWWAIILRYYTDSDGWRLLTLSYNTFMTAENTRITQLFWTWMKCGDKACRHHKTQMNVLSQITQHTAMLGGHTNSSTQRQCCNFSYSLQAPGFIVASPYPKMYGSKTNIGNKNTFILYHTSCTGKLSQRTCVMHWSFYTQRNAQQCLKYSRLQN